MCLTAGRYPAARGLRVTSGHAFPSLQARMRPGASAPIRPRSGPDVRCEAMGIGPPGGAGRWARRRFGRRGRECAWLGRLAPGAGRAACAGAGWRSATGCRFRARGVRRGGGFRHRIRRFVGGQGLRQDFGKGRIPAAASGRAGPVSADPGGRRSGSLRKKRATLRAVSPLYGAGHRARPGKDIRNGRGATAVRDRARVRRVRFRAFAAPGVAARCGAGRDAVGRAQARQRKGEGCGTRNISIST